MMVMYGVHTQAGALEARIKKQDASIEGVVNAKSEPKALETDPAMRMLVGADFRSFATGRVGPRDNALEFERFKVLCTKEDVDPSGLTAGDRYSKVVAHKFSPSSLA